MRLFAGVYPDERFAAALTTALDPWRERLPLRWTPAPMWHVTLQFLGEWPADRVAGLTEGLEPVAGRAPFGVTPQGIGAFPGLARPRVLILHLDSGGQLERLAGAVRATVGRCWADGPQDTRPFRAHLTLARAGGALSAGDIKSLSDMDLGPLPDFTVTGLSLVASELHPAGARHREVAFRRLRKKGE